jgi:hypothetical protein
LPAATTLCYESVILWTNNKTSEWLNSLDHDIKNKLLDNARVRAPEVKRMFNDKRETIKKQKLNKIKEKKVRLDLYCVTPLYEMLFDKSVHLKPYLNHDFLILQLSHQ